MQRNHEIWDVSTLTKRGALLKQADIVNGYYFRIISIVVLVILFGFLQVGFVQGHAHERSKVKGLSKKHAEFRASIIQKVHYDLSFQLDGSNDAFYGQVAISFSLKKKSKPITVDFVAGKIELLNVNGQQVTKPSYNELFLTIPVKYLKTGSNRIEIKFSHPYSRTGSGFYRFKDVEDGNVYLYTDFEPFSANQFFPCFDQPDLKASYTVKAEVPSAWQVISAVREKRVKQGAKGKKIWMFPKSAIFSTYIFSLHAGPYSVWTAKAGKIPLRLYARKAFAKYVNAKEWFKITKQGFAYYQKYFKTPYPFIKYDQLVVPDFNSGAMENVGAVTFNENYMPRGEWTNRERENLAEVILHEMAHMWFGNLVTMKWWDDLWLNESFASIMATMATQEGTEFNRAWHSFFGDMKSWAYWEDQLVTRHPIVTEVRDTEQAFINFDGITYGKGASVLKQLAYYIGPKQFQKGVQQYFKKYAYKNTVMNDFIGSLAKASKTNLKKWTETWLMTQGVNTVAVDYKCEGDRIRSFALRQLTPDRNTPLKKHRTLLGLYDLKQGRVVLRSAIAVNYDGKVTQVKALKGKKCPLMIYPNHEDYDFVKVNLDKRTLAATKKHLGQIEDPFVRMMFWQSLWDMVRDAKLPVQEYLELSYKYLFKERDIKIATGSAGRLSSALYYLPDDKERHSTNAKLEGLLWKALKDAKSGSDFQKLWLDHTIGMAKSEQALSQLVKLFHGKIKIAGLTIDQDRRWSIIAQLTRESWKGADTLRVAELKRDKSESGKKSAMAAEASQPMYAIKRKWFKKISAANSDLPLARARAVMNNLFPQRQDDLRERFTNDFYKALPKLSKYKGNEFLTSFTQFLVPTVCKPEKTRKLKAFINGHKNLPPIVVKRLRIAHQEDERCINIRRVAQGY